MNYPLVIDAHCDSPSQMYRLRDFGIDNDFAQVDFPKMQRGKVQGSFFAAFIPAYMGGEEAFAYANTLLDTLDVQMKNNSDKVAYSRCASSCIRNYRNGLISVLIGLENASALNEKLENVKHFHKRGVRYITLVHSADNTVADSCTGKGTWGGLTEFGKELIPAMNDGGMIIDLAHASDSTMRQTLELSRHPLAYTHGCCRALASHKRNISDNLIRDIAHGGGVVCISMYPVFLSDEFVCTLKASGLEEKEYIEIAFKKDPADPAKKKAWEELLREFQALQRPGIECFADHIEHAVSVAGIEHVGIGTDYDGIDVTATGMEDISSFYKLWDVLASRGFSEKDMAKIGSGNILRVMKEVRKR